MKDWNLSDEEILMLKDKDDGTNLEESIMVVPSKKVREFIRQLKENFKGFNSVYPSLSIKEKIDKLVGDKLI